ncbi:MAG: hypothetical protein Q9201_000303 [Fulgogasparrea decipioides]
MALTRRLHIYEDPPIETQPQQNAADEHQAQIVSLQPTMMPPSDTRSPLKPTQSNNAQPKPIFGKMKKVPLPPRHEAVYNNTDSLVKQLQIPVYPPIAPSSSENVVFGPLPAFHNLDKENRHPLDHSHHNDNYAEFPDPSVAFKSSSIKRAAPKPAPRQTRNPKPAQLLTPATQQPLPLPEDLPPIEDTHKKPNYTYSKIIGMAILRAKDRQLTLDQLYKWISETFSYFSMKDDGWKNSIRHNLSIHAEFVKKGRSKDDPGKGNYWVIKPGKEEQFYNDKSTRRHHSAGGPTMKTFSQPLSEPSSDVWSLPAKVGPKPVAQVACTLEQPSSDATIPASNPASPEHRLDQTGDMPPPVPRIQLSSPCLGIGSSPPVALHDEIGEDSPQLAFETSLPLSQDQSRKRNAAAMDDSGYFSSIESSATRRVGTADPRQGMDKDRPRLKRGRAEEEIARIRSSSHDASPSKGRSLPKPVATHHFSSSPLRGFDLPQLELHLTPREIFELPDKPPASISPSTNLRIFRDETKKLVGPTPPRNLGTLNDAISISPGLGYPVDGFSAFDDAFPFGVDEDADNFFYPGPLSVSPMKRSARRSRLARPSKTSSALANITNTHQNCKALAPASKAPYLESPIRHVGISKSLIGAEICGDVAHEDFINQHLLADEDGEQGDFNGIDLSQGFQKIGRKQNSIPKSKINRPVLGPRSHTSRI